MKIKNCLIVDDLHPIAISLLEEAGITIHSDENLTREEILKILPDYDCLLIRSKTVVDEDFLHNAPKLKIIGRAGAGVDQIDQELLKRKNIALVNAPEGNMTAVGEHAIGMLLALMNNMMRADFQVRNQKWERELNRGYEIEGKTIAIIGYGNMGNAFAKRLQGFNCNIITYDKFKTNYGNKYAKQVSLIEIFETADILSLHVPLNKSSFHMVNKKFLNSFKKPIWLVNLARGKVITNKDLLDALNNGNVKAAALDVIENEKFNTYTKEENTIFEQLKQTNKVIFSPHIGGWTFESLSKISEVLANKIIDFSNKS